MFNFLFNILRISPLSLLDVHLIYSRSKTPVNRCFVRFDQIKPFISKSLHEIEVSGTRNEDVTCSVPG